MCSAAGKVRPGSSSTDPSGPRMGKLTIWDLKTMSPQVRVGIYSLGTFNMILDYNVVSFYSQ